MRNRGERLLGELLRASHLVSLEGLPDLTTRHAKDAGFSQTMIYVTDLRHRNLAPLPGQYDEAGHLLRPIRVDGTMAGRAFRHVEIVHAGVTDDVPEDPYPVPDPEPERLWVPLLHGTERVGVLGATVSGTGEADKLLLSQLADLVSLIIVSKRSTSDAYARLVRADLMSVSAEVLWNLMPITTRGDNRVVVSAALEPAHEVGGDAYDYAINGDVLHLGIFDAMGHDLSSGLTASTAVATFRNNRRQDRDLLTTSERIDETIAEQFDPPRFTTGILATLDTRTGWLSWVNRGHHPPLVLRQGRQVATLETQPSSPMGLGLNPPAESAHYQLEPGDRLVFYTDGIVEARNSDGEVFGLERFTDFLTRREADELPPPETLRRLTQSVLEHHEGRLQDDATVLLVEWATRYERRLTLRPESGEVESGH